MAFTCPRCGGHEFRSSKLRDGSIERECLGQVFDEVHVALVKPKYAQPMAGAGVVPEAPSVAIRRPRRCIFVWPSVEDHLYGVVDAPDNEPPGTC